MKPYDWIYWPTFAAVAAWATWLLYRAVIGRKNDGRPRCPECWYDMTGAPSLTCPECGNDAKSPKQLTRRRRSPKRWVVVAVLLATACWYSTHVRWRLNRGETVWEAAYPTTCLILNIFPNDHDPWPSMLQNRWWEDEGEETVLPAWQLWLRAYVTYRDLKQAPLDVQAGHPAQPWVWPLTQVSGHSDFARWLHGKVITEHPAEGIRLQAAWEAEGNDNQEFVLRQAVWKAIDSGQLEVADAHSILGGYGASSLRRLNDQQFLHEFATVTRPDGGGAWRDATELYMSELLRRPTIDKAKVLAKIDPGESLLREFLLLVARRRAEGKPDPLKLELSVSADGKTLHLSVQNLSDEAISLQWWDEHSDDMTSNVQHADLVWRSLSPDRPIRSGGLFDGPLFGRPHSIEWPEKIESGKTFETSIPLAKMGTFRSMPSPGERLQAVLHFGGEDPLETDGLFPSAQVIIPEKK